MSDTRMNERVNIRLSGCDDETMFDFDATPEQAVFLRELSRLSYANSQYGCQPVLVINNEILERAGKGK